MSEDSTKNQPEHNAFMRWKHTWSGRLAWTVLDLAIAYIFVSFAINSGTLWQWGVAMLFALDGIYNFVRFIGKLIKHGSKDETTEA